MKHGPTGHQVEGDIASLTTSRVQQSPKRLLLSMLAILVALAGYLGLRSSDGEQTLPLPDSPTPTTNPTPETTTGADCDVGRLAASLRDGLPALTLGVPRSPGTLTATSPHVVRGQLLEATSSDGGTRISIEPRQIRNKPGINPIVELDSLWTPAANPPTGILRGSFVAFLNGERSLGGWMTEPDGLWVACDDTSEARSVLNRNSRQQPTTLDELWSAIREPQRVLLMHEVDGSAVFEVFDDDGSRFRMSLPAFVTDGLLLQRLRSSSRDAPIRIEGDNVAISILYGPCPGAETSDSSLNPLGSVVWLGPDGAEACRERDHIRMRVAADWEGRDADLQLLDLRPMSVGPIYGSEFLSATYPFSSEKWGPIVFPTEDIAIHPTSDTAVTAVRSTTLKEVWTVDPGGFNTIMRTGPEGLYLSVGGGPLLFLDPATGGERWRIERYPTERFGELTRELLSSSFPTKGDETAPLLRRFDAEQGTVLWTARGQEGTEWHGQITVAGDLVMVTDGEMFRGFSYETGSPLWISDLGEPTAATRAGPIAELEVDAGRVLIVNTLDGKVLRVDPTNGQKLWSTSVPSGLLNGTDYAEGGLLAIDIANPSGNVLLDPETGEVLEPDSDTFECPITSPTERFVPPEPWPAAPTFADKAWYGTDDLWTVVPMDNIKSIWWSAKFTDATTEPQPELEVIYERLDEPAELVVLPGPATNGFTEETGLLMAAGLAPEEPGCWKATATYKGSTLEVVWEQ